MDNIENLNVEIDTYLLNKIVSPSDDIYMY